MNQGILSLEDFCSNISRIMDYVKENVELYRNFDTELLEVIITPEIPFLIVAKLTVKNVTSPFSEKLDKVENETAYLEEKGIRVVARGDYKNIFEDLGISSEEFSNISGKLMSEPMDEADTGFDKFPVFDKEIKQVREYILNIFRRFYPNSWLWEIEIQTDKYIPVLARLVARDQKGYGLIVDPRVEARRQYFRKHGFIPELLRDNDSYRNSVVLDRRTREKAIGSHRAFVLAVKDYLERSKHSLGNGYRKKILTIEANAITTRRGIYEK